MRSVVIDGNVIDFNGAEYEMVQLEDELTLNFSKIVNMLINNLSFPS